MLLRSIEDEMPLYKRFEGYDLHLVIGLHQWGGGGGGEKGIYCSREMLADMDCCQ